MRAWEYHTISVILVALWRLTSAVLPPPRNLNTLFTFKLLEVQTGLYCCQQSVKAIIKSLNPPKACPWSFLVGGLLYVRSKIACSRLTFRKVGASPVKGRGVCQLDSENLLQASLYSFFACARIAL